MCRGGCTGQRGRVQEPAGHRDPIAGGRSDPACAAGHGADSGVGRRSGCLRLRGAARHCLTAGVRRDGRTTDAARHLRRTREHVANPVSQRIIDGGRRRKVAADRIEPPHARPARLAEGDGIRGYRSRSPLWRLHLCHGLDGRLERNRPRARPSCAAFGRRSLLAGSQCELRAPGERRHPLQLRDRGRPPERDVLVPPPSARPVRRSSIEWSFWIVVDR